MGRGVEEGEVCVGSGSGIGLFPISRPRVTVDSLINFERGRVREEEKGRRRGTGGGGDERNSVERCSLKRRGEVRRKGDGS